MHERWKIWFHSKLKYTYIFSLSQKKNHLIAVSTLANLDTSIHHRKVLICTCIRTSLLYFYTKLSRHIDVYRCIHSSLVEEQVDCN